jgi:hypothetical protein
LGEIEGNATATYFMVDDRSIAIEAQQRVVLNCQGSIAIATGALESFGQMEKCVSCKRRDWLA